MPDPEIIYSEMVDGNNAILILDRPIQPKQFLEVISDKLTDPIRANFTKYDDDTVVYVNTQYGDRAKFRFHDAIYWETPKKPSIQGYYIKAGETSYVWGRGLNGATILLNDVEQKTFYVPWQSDKEKWYFVCFRTEDIGSFQLKAKSQTGGESDPVIVDVQVENRIVNQDKIYREIAPNANDNTIYIRCRFESTDYEGGSWMKTMHNCKFVNCVFDRVGGGIGNNNVFISCVWTRVGKNLSMKNSRNNFFFDTLFDRTQRGIVMQPGPSCIGNMMYRTQVRSVGMISNAGENILIEGGQGEGGDILQRTAYSISGTTITCSELISSSVRKGCVVIAGRYNFEWREILSISGQDITIDKPFKGDMGDEIMLVEAAVDNIWSCTMSEGGRGVVLSFFNATALRNIIQGLSTDVPSDVDFRRLGCRAHNFIRDLQLKGGAVLMGDSENRHNILVSSYLPKPNKDMRNQGGASNIETSIEHIFGDTILRDVSLNWI